MKFFDWLKNLGKRRGAAQGDSVPNDSEPGPGRQGAPASEFSNVPGWRRKVIEDPRLLPKAPRKNWWERAPKVLDRDEARRRFSPSLRTRNAAIRALLLDEGLLAERGLPVWVTEEDVAGALGLAVQELRWLASHRFDDEICHYVQFEIPKRSGGSRVIMAPKRRLKSVQRTLLGQLVSKLPVSPHAHGFVAGRSVASNAQPHVGKRVVLRFDLRDFFGTVTFARVRGYLIAMGYGYDVATVLSLVMTEAPRQRVEVDDKVVHVPTGHRFCVQGAPTSPGMCNAIATKLDRRLAGLAGSVGFSYTRYADDMTFSGDDETQIGFLLRLVNDIVVDEGFVLNSSKTKVMRSGGRQLVTGVTVNRTLGLSRSERRRLRAKVHQMSPQSPALEITRLRGELAYLRMLNPAQAAALTPDWLGSPTDSW